MLYIPMPDLEFLGLWGILSKASMRAIAVVRGDEQGESFLAASQEEMLHFTFIVLVWGETAQRTRKATCKSVSFCDSGT